MTRLTQSLSLSPFLSPSFSATVNCITDNCRPKQKERRKAIENKSLIAPAGKIKLLNQLCQHRCHWKIALKSVYLGGWGKRKTCGILWLPASRVPRAQLSCKWHTHRETPTQTVVNRKVAPKAVGQLASLAWLTICGASCYCIGTYGQPPLSGTNAVGFMLPPHAATKTARAATKTATTTRTVNIALLGKKKTTIDSVNYR